ncbi:MAG: hypothetical protein ACYC0X_23245 [Pirellulaceae bacterium]
MMKRAIAVLVLLGPSCVCFAADESQEPPLNYTLDINDQPHEIVLDKPVTIAGAYNDPKVVLRASSTRQFSYGNVAFHYPASFSWEAEMEGQNEKTWTLSGNDFKIMYFILPQALSVDAYAQAMTKHFEKGITRVGDTERKLGSRQYKGKRLSVELAGTSLAIEVYALRANSGSRLLVLQDSPPDERATSEEGEKTLNLLSASFEETTASNKTDAGDGK